MHLLFSSMVKAFVGFESQKFNFKRLSRFFIRKHIESLLVLPPHIQMFQKDQKDQKDVLADVDIEKVTDVTASELLGTGAGVGTPDVEALPEHKLPETPKPEQ